ncbi:MAG: phosphate acyltransferase PlsX [Anaerolineales bacterium]|nr:phosphate acyltransferase PlsX [Anaerolineales bacterium]
MTRIVLDAMGSDNHPSPEVEACLQAYSLWGEPVTLVGQAELLLPVLEAKGVGPEAVKLVDAPEVLEMTDHPADAARDKPLSSMAVGIDLLKQGQADAFVTAGNTGGAMATALFRLGRIRGVRRPALATVFPIRTGRAILTDIGANADCRPEYLVQFAIFGSLYARHILGIEQPRVGLLSNGEESTKGNLLVKETYPLMQAAGLEFIGNLEPKEFFAGKADVLVTDGFSGNVMLKTSEAVSSFLIDLIRGEIRSSLLTSLGGMLARPAFRKVRSVLDPAEYGAGPLLGVDGLVFVGHGRSDARALVNALRVARQAVASGLLDAMRQAIQSRLTPGEPEAQP